MYRIAVDVANLTDVAFFEVVVTLGLVAFFVVLTTFGVEVALIDEEVFFGLVLVLIATLLVE